MRHIDSFESFSIYEQRTLAALDELCGVEPTNEGFMDWIKKIVDFFERINDSIRNLMLTMMEKGLMALGLLKNFFSKILEKVKGFKKTHPVIFRTVILTLVLIVILFVLCSAAAGKHPVAPDRAIDAAIGFIRNMQLEGTDEYDNGTLMKAQAYLFSLKKGGGDISNHAFGKQAIDLATGTLKVVQRNVEEINKMAPGIEKKQSFSYLINLAEQGAKMASYKIVEYQNSLTGKYAGYDMDLVYKP